MHSFLNYSFDKPWFFTNFSFLLVLGIFLMIYAAVINNNLVRKLYVIAFSLFFYYKSSGPFLGIFILLIIGDYNIAKAIETVKNNSTKKLLMVISIILSLSFLLYFKYSAFFLTNLNDLFNTRFTIHKLFLPIGISFYTFQLLPVIYLR